jgi:hypothetical protein
MPTVKKPKCAAADSDLCMVTCPAKYPNDDTKYRGTSDSDEKAPLGAKDAECKMCYPYEGRVKGRAGCGGVGLTDYQVQTSTLVGISGTVILRVLIGPISDGIGIRTTFAVLLVLASIPGFLLATSNSYAAIVVFRFLVGFAGGSFVLTQLWTTTMFDLNVVGIANATSAGWGNLGGGVANILNSIVFAACKRNGMDNNTAWRLTVAWSPAVLFILGILTFFFTDDSPYGNFSELKKKQNKADAAEAELEALKTGGEPGSIAARSLIDAACSWQTWILHLCYMFSFGVEVCALHNLHAPREGQKRMACVESAWRLLIKTLTSFRSSQHFSSSSTAISCRTSPAPSA